MAMGRRRQRQEVLFISADGLPKSQGHAFYQTLNRLLAEAEFDRWIENRCQQYYNREEKRGQIQIQTNAFNLGGNPPPLTTAEVGGVTVAHEFMHMVINPSDPANWSAEHRINVFVEFEPNLMRSGVNYTKDHFREGQVKIDVITQDLINLAGNPAFM